MPVAAPVTWSELRDIDSPRHFSIRDTAVLIERATGRALRGWGLAGQVLLEFVFEVFLAHALLSRRQCRRSPARNGMTSCSPNGRLVGTSHSSRTSVIWSVLRGRP